MCGSADLLRSARLLSTLLPSFLAAGRFAGTQLKPAKCDVVMVGARRVQHAQAEAKRTLAEASPEWAMFAVVHSGKYLGLHLGPGAEEHSWNGPARNVEGAHS